MDRKPKIEVKLIPVITINNQYSYNNNSSDASSSDDESELGEFNRYNINPDWNEADAPIAGPSYQFDDRAQVTLFAKLSKVEKEYKKIKKDIRSEREIMGIESITTEAQHETNARLDQLLTDKRRVKSELVMVRRALKEKFPNKYQDSRYKPQAQGEIGYFDSNSNDQLSIIANGSNNSGGSMKVGNFVLPFITSTDQAMVLARMLEKRSMPSGYYHSTNTNTNTNTTKRKTNHTTTNSNSNMNVNKSRNSKTRKCGNEFAMENDFNDSNDSENGNNSIDEQRIETTHTRKKKKIYENTCDNNSNNSDRNMSNSSNSNSNNNSNNNNNNNNNSYLSSLPTIDARFKLTQWSADHTSVTPSNDQDFDVAIPRARGIKEKLDKNSSAKEIETNILENYLVHEKQLFEQRRKERARVGIVSMIFRVDQFLTDDEILELNNKELNRERPVTWVRLLDDALNQCVPGDEILLCEGTHEWGRKVPLCASVTIRGLGTSKWKTNVESKPGMESFLWVTGSETRVVLYNLQLKCNGGRM